MLGLIPDCPPERVRSVGNAAGAGAVRALLSGAARHEIADVARDVTKIETAIEPRFQEHFVAAMAFPHATDPYAEPGRSRDAAGPHGRRPTGPRPADAAVDREPRRSTSDRDAAPARLAGVPAARPPAWPRTSRPSPS